MSADSTAIVRTFHLLANGIRVKHEAGRLRAMVRTLYGLSYSPWTHRALFSLDHHRLVYRYVEHLPLLGELRLRRLSKSAKPTVPLLITDGAPTMGSGEIARLADREGAEEKLFGADMRAITEWEVRADAILEVARARVVAGLKASHEAQKEALPPFVPGPFRSIFAFTAKQGTSFVAKKHAVAGEPDQRVVDEVFPVLDVLHAALADKGEDTCLLGTFGYADIVMATAVSALSPTPSEPGTRKLGAASLALWTYPEAPARYPLVYAWRDRVYARRKLPA